jgi:hypothetical protein
MGQSSYAHIVRNLIVYSLTISYPVTPVKETDGFFGEVGQKNCPFGAITVESGVGCAAAMMRAALTRQQVVTCVKPACHSFPSGVWLFRKGTLAMDKPGSNAWGFLLAGVLGAIGGSIFVAVATRAIPKMMSQMMAQMMPKMMQNMREQMKESGCSPDT